MDISKVSASVRPTSGKGAARRMRAEGRIPAISYGKGKATRSLTVDPTEVVAILESDRGINTLFQLDVEGQALDVMMGEYQYHPVSRTLLHADFIEVDPSAPVTAQVPLILTGKPQGVVMGGKLRQVFREVPVRCVPSKIPVSLSHDITSLNIEEHVAAQDLQLPEGVEICLPAKRTLVAIAADRRAKGEEEETAKK